MKLILPSPKELDKQSPVRIDKWIDIDSEECRDKDPDPVITKQFLRIGFRDPPFMGVDSLGRIFGKGANGIWYPFHFNIGKKLYGFRMSKKAAN